MRLAEDLGHVDVDAMLNSITPQQADEWMAYYIIKSGAEVKDESSSLDNSLKAFRGLAGV
jgi:hypothetical protein